MSILKCEACCAPLKVTPGCKYVICEYCGTQNIVEQLTANTSITQRNSEDNIEKSNVLLLSIPSCGSTIFEKKIFNVYRKYAELIDAKSKIIEIHIDYCNVAKKSSFLGSNVIFKMKNGNKHMIKTLTQKNYQQLLQALNGLV